MAGLALLLTSACDRNSGTADKPAAAPAVPFAGSYAGNQLSATFNPSGDGGYTGQIKLGDKTFPIQARENGTEMKGKFSAGTDNFQFTATLNGRELSLDTGTSHYTLERIGGTANPLDTAPHANAFNAAPASAPPGNPPPAASDAAPLPDVPLPNGFSELGSTPSGRSIFSNFSNIRNIDDLIQHVGDAIGGMLGAKPQFDSACVDAKNKNGGIANFSATLKGAPIKGVVIFGVNPQAVSSATVIYSRPNIPHDEFMSLMQTIPAQPKMHTTQMPDGSGSIDVPEGWTCKSQSMTAGPIWVQGPKGQNMMVGIRMAVYTPDSMVVRQARRAHDSAENLYSMTGGRGMPPNSMDEYLSVYNISPPVGPEDAFTQVIPAYYARARKNGKTWQQFGEIKFKGQVPPMIPGDEAEVFGSTMTFYKGDKPAGDIKRMMMRVEDTKPDATGMWTVLFDQYVAPESTAATEFPLMMQVYASINIPQAAVQRQLDKDNKAFQATLAYFRAKNDALLERGRQFQANQKEQFERFEQQQAAQAQARHNACSDMIESSLGVRDVLDTATGEMHKVDLYNSTAITDTLNNLANDPNRFVQIPLRYER